MLTRHLLLLILLQSCAVYAEHTLELYVQGKLMPYCDCHVSNAVYLGCLLADNVSQKLSDLLQVNIVHVHVYVTSLNAPKTPCIATRQCEFAVSEAKRLPACGKLADE